MGSEEEERRQSKSKGSERGERKEEWQRVRKGKPQRGGERGR